MKTKVDLRPIDGNHLPRLHWALLQAFPYVNLSDLSVYNIAINHSNGMEAGKVSDFLRSTLLVKDRVEI